MGEHEDFQDIFECPEGSCCGMVGDDNLIPPPILTKYDRDRLREAGVPEHHFHKRHNPESGYSYFQLGTGSACTGCDFFDLDSHVCTVYTSRPLDCHLFPLDVDNQNGELVWIAYTCACLPSESDLERFATHAEENILPFFTPQELWVFASLTNRMYKEGRWKKLRPVQLDSAGI